MIPKATLAGIGAGVWKWMEHRSQMDATRQLDEALIFHLQHLKTSNYKYLFMIINSMKEEDPYTY
jgi:hypothetical protein